MQEYNSCRRCGIARYEEFPSLGICKSCNIPCRKCGETITANNYVVGRRVCRQCRATKSTPQSREKSRLRMRDVRLRKRIAEAIVTEKLHRARSLLTQHVEYLCTDKLPRLATPVLYRGVCAACDKAFEEEGNFYQKRCTSCRKIRNRWHYLVAKKEGQKYGVRKCLHCGRKKPLTKAYYGSPSMRICNFCTRKLYKLDHDGDLAGWRTGEEKKLARHERKLSLAKSRAWDRKINQIVNKPES